MGSALDVLANFNPSRFAAETQSAELRPAQIRAETAQAQAVTQDQQLRNKLIQQQLRDAEIQRQIFADSASGANQQALPSVSPEDAAMLPDSLRGALGVQGAPTGWRSVDQPAPVQPMAPRAPMQTQPQGPNYFSDPIAIQREMLRRGASPMSAAAAAKGILEMNTGISKLSADQLDLEAKNHQRVADSLQGYLETPDSSKASVYPQLYADAIAHEPNLANELPAPRAGYAPTQADLAHVIGKVHLFGQLLDQAKEKAGIGLSTAQTDEATAKTEHQQLINDAVRKSQSAQQSGHNPIDAIFPATLDPRINASYKAAYDAAMSTPPDAEGRHPAADGIVSAAAQHASEIAKANNPQIRAGKVADAVATETATAPIKRANAIAEAKALREGDNPALSGVPPAAAASAVSAATKLDTDYLKAKEAVESMGKLLDLAGKGNTAAGANIPMVGVGAANAINGIKRINSADISQYGSAGSLLQKIQGKLEGWTEGQPITASVRGDIRELHQQLGDSAWKAYTSGIDALNKRSGAKFGPAAEPPNIRQPAQAAPVVQHSPSTGQFRYSNDGGKTWQPGKPPQQ